MLKRYHEIAHFLEENTIAGFWLCDTQENRALYATHEEFIELCKQDEIQYFVWDSVHNTYCIRYSDEELADMGASAKVCGLYKDTKSYFADDVKFRQKDYDTMQKHPAICLGSVVSSMTMPLVGRVLSIIVIGSDDALINFRTMLPHELENFIRLMPKFESTVLGFVLPLKLFAKYATSLDRILLSTYAVESNPEILSRSSVAKVSKFQSLFMKTASKDEQRQILEICNTINNRTRSLLPEDRDKSIIGHMHLF